MPPPIPAPARPDGSLAARAAAAAASAEVALAFCDWGLRKLGSLGMTEPNRPLAAAEAAARPAVNMCPNRGEAGMLALGAVPLVPLAPLAPISPSAPGMTAGPPIEGRLSA